MSAPALAHVRPGQAAIGLGLAALMIGAWLGLHVWGVLFQPLTAPGLAAVPLLVALQTWLGVGLFIVAHDAMHGSLAPGRPAINRAVGRICVFLYAAFSYDRLIEKHFAHHRHSGTPDDPDFHADGPRAFGPWFLAFFRRYFGWREFLILCVPILAYLALGASPVNMIVFWGLPAIGSALQLFYFGTYLPHRHEDETFADQHRARSSDFSWLASLLTCFHFGYHHEHHTAPHLPWWRLPEARREPADSLQRGRA